MNFPSLPPPTPWEPKGCQDHTESQAHCLANGRAKWSLKDVGGTGIIAPGCNHGMLQHLDYFIAQWLLENIQQKLQAAWICRFSWLGIWHEAAACAQLGTGPALPETLHIWQKFHLEAFLFLPKKERQQQNQSVFCRPRFKASMSDTLHASLHVHLWEPDSIDFSGFSLGGGRSLREMPTQNGNLSQPQRFSRNSNEAAVANTRKWRLLEGPKTFFPKQFTVGVLNATLDLAALVLVGVVGFLGSEVVLSPVVSGCLFSYGGWVLVGVAAFLGSEMVVSLHVGGGSWLVWPHLEQRIQKTKSQVSI